MAVPGVIVRPWAASDSLGYDALLNDAPDAMFNHSRRYLQFLQCVLGAEAAPCHLVAERDGRLVGALPAFRRDGPYGPVVNSLPFFGSHGGALVLPHEDCSVRHALSASFSDYCDSIDAVSSTVVESPLGARSSTATQYRANWFDDRLGQISSLPEAATATSAEEKVLAQCHSKTRNQVRKGQRAGFEFETDNTITGFQQLWDLHQQNMVAIGGTVKPWSVFQAVIDTFTAREDYDLYLAKVGSEVAAALLIFYFKDTVEYFTPAIAANHRSAQPLNATILHAMVSSIVQRGARNWNWGGTWRSQDGVYHFKSRWGARDYVYRYHIHSRLSVETVRSIDKRDLIQGYPFFYVVPFRTLGHVEEALGDHL